MLQAVDSLIAGNMLVAWLVLIATFVLLCKSADVFVDSAVEVAIRTKIPKIIVGLVLVSLATTAPELTVSVIASFRGKPEMALGNAIGSIICNGGLALPLCALFSVSAIHVMPGVMRTSGTFLLLAMLALFIFVIGDQSLVPWEGAILLLIFAIYTTVLIWRHRKEDATTITEVPGVHIEKKHRPLVLAGQFVLSVAGVIIASDLIVRSAASIAHGLGIPESVIALALVAFGTSVPEVATCVAAGRKGEGDVAVGNIIGANIMNVCWVAGASSL
ncbi:MAG: sodium:calcium antiporter, partial [Lentisphaeria bacterium]